MLYNNIPLKSVQLVNYALFRKCGYKHGVDRFLLRKIILYYVDDEGITHLSNVGPVQ
jgi:hypothetical protein